MSTTLTLPSPEPGPLLSIDQFSDTQIDALIDHYVFSYSPICTGSIEFQYGGLEHAMYRCVICGAPAQRPIAGNYYDCVEHPRQIPRYSIEDIVFAMKHRSRLTQWIFAQSLRPKTSTGPMAQVLHAVIMGITSRSVAIAALKALGVLDAGGAFLVRIA